MNFKYCHTFSLHNSLLYFYFISENWYIFSFHFGFALYSYNALLRQICKTEIIRVFETIYFPQLISSLLIRNVNVLVCFISFFFKKLDPQYCSVSDIDNSVSFSPVILPHLVISLRTSYFLSEEENSYWISTTGLQIIYLNHNYLYILIHIIRLYTCQSFLQGSTVLDRNGNIQP